MIFPWLWRVLPGGAASKVTLLLLICAAVITVLFLMVFPSLESFLTPPPVVEAVENQNSQNPFVVNISKARYF